jgi:hypothetical protein
MAISVTEKTFNFANTFITKELVDVPGCSHSRIIITEESQIKHLPWGQEYKDVYRKELKRKKAKFGIAIDNIGTPHIIEVKEQIVGELILKTMQEMGFRIMK